MIVTIVINYPRKNINFINQKFAVSSGKEISVYLNYHLFYVCVKREWCINLCLNEIYCLLYYTIASRKITITGRKVDVIK